jgi:hypothetical protein
VFLTEQQVVDLTHRVKGAWQARELVKLGIPFRRRSDGTLLVLHDDLKTEQDHRSKQPRLRAG